MRIQNLTEEQFESLTKRVSGGKPLGKPVTSATAHRLAHSPYKSKIELQYANQLDLEQKAGLIKSWRYEPMSLTLASGKRYRPDFMVHTIDAARISYIELIEVKGRTGKNRRDGMTHLRWAAQLYPMFTWRLMTWNGSGFVGEYIT